MEFVAKTAAKTAVSFSPLPFSMKFALKRWVIPKAVPALMAKKVSQFNQSIVLGKKKT